MTREITTEIIINATPEIVWEALMNTENYPIWNPFILSIKGVFKEGEQIVVNIKPVDAKVSTFNPTIIRREENKNLQWLGTLPIKGIFDGEHSFQLVDNLNGTTTFIHSEKFRGILVPFFKNIIENKTLKGFRLMNEALKYLIENK